MRALRIHVSATVVMAVLFLTFGIWGISGGGKALAQDRSLFSELSFKCYVINQGTAPNEEVTLFDQFHPPELGNSETGGEKVTVRTPQLLCTPALKVRSGETYVGGIRELPIPHLKCYKITPSAPPVNEVVTLLDQFSTEGEDVKVETPQFLCEFACKERHIDGVDSDSISFPGCLEPELGQIE